MEFLTAGDVALMLKISPKSVYRWALKDPTMPVLKIGGTVRFPRERLERWLRSREQGPGRTRQQTDSHVPSRDKSAEGRGSA